MMVGGGERVEAPVLTCLGGFTLDLADVYS